MGLLPSAQGLIFSKAHRDALELYNGVVGGSVNSPFERASACRVIINRFVAWPSASLSSAAWRLMDRKNMKLETLAILIRNLTKKYNLFLLYCKNINLIEGICYRKILWLVLIHILIAGFLDPINYSYILFLLNYILFRICCMLY